MQIQNIGLCPHIWKKNLQFLPWQHSTMSFTQSLWCSMLWMYGSWELFCIEFQTRMMASRPAEYSRPLIASSCRALTPLRCRFSSASRMTNDTCIFFRPPWLFLCVNILPSRNCRRRRRRRLSCFDPLSFYFFCVAPHPPRNRNDRTWHTTHRTVTPGFTPATTGRNIWWPISIREISNKHRTTLPEMRINFLLLVTLLTIAVWSTFSCTQGAPT